MVAFARPSRLRTAALLAALAVHRIAAAETTPDPEQQLLDQVQAILAQEGPRSVALLEPLTRLSLQYQEQGDPALALVTIERALDVLRVNNGLHTLDQVPLLMQRIRNEEERHNDAGAWETEQELLTLLRRHLDDLRTVPILREIADRQMRALHEYLEFKNPPELFLGCFYQVWSTADGSGCDSGSRQTVVQGMLAEAQRNYADAIGVLLRHGLYGSAELRELEMDLLHGVYLFRSLYEGRNEPPAPMIPPLRGITDVEPWRGRVAPIRALANWNEPRDDAASRALETTQARLMLSYYRGRQSLRRLYLYDKASTGSAVLLAEAIAQIADWDLLYSQNGSAVRGYEVAHAMLRDARVPAASIERLFAPTTPVVLPAFERSPFARNETSDVTGHVDVAFEITQYGRARAVEILGSANASDAEIDRVVDLISSNRFRPRAMDGQFGAASRVVVHYALHD